jgi:hypothetical protein
MTTFWLSFNDQDAPANERFLGVAIFDMDESDGELSIAEIARRAWQLGINPGGSVAIQEVDSIPEEYKNQLLTDDDLLISLGSGGRKSLA